MWALALALTLAAVALPAPATACSCQTPTLLGSFFRSSIVTVVIATPQRVISENGATRMYGLLGGGYPSSTTFYKGCSTKLERFTVYGSQSSCDTTFALGVPVLLFLTESQFVGPCDYTVPASDLTAEDVAFLAPRAGCGSDVTPEPSYAPAPSGGWGGGAGGWLHGGRGRPHLVR